MISYSKTLSPMQVFNFVRKQSYFDRKLIIIDDDGKKYDLQESCYFDPFLLFHIYNLESEKVQALMFDFSSDDGSIELFDGKIHVSDYPYVQWTIAKADGNAISI